MSQNKDLDEIVRLLRQLADRLAQSGPGHPAGGLHEIMRAWPAGSGAGVPGMSGEPVSSHEPGGNLLRQLLPPGISIQEKLFNVSPDVSWFSPNVSPSSPVQFTLGTFQVPKSHIFWMYDYEFQIFVQSGVDPNDIVPATDGRFFGVMGFDVTFTGRRLAAVTYELDPHPAQLGVFQQAGTGGGGSRPAPPAAFNIAAFNQFASATSAGTSLLPAWQKLMGARQGPFSLIASEGDVVQLACAIFRQVPAPLASITGRMAGYLMSKTVSETIVNRLRPR